MKLLAALLMLFLLSPVLAQHGHKGARELQRPMPAPERRMGWEERQKLREQVHSGQMSRDEARQRWREQRGAETGRNPQQREQLRRDVIDANRDLQRR